MPNILITSAGRRVSLVENFKKELKEKYGSEAKVYTTDLEPDMSTACRSSDGSFKLGKFTDSNYIAEMMAICKENDVRLVIPTLDPELLLYAQNRELFKKEGIELLVSDFSLVKVFRDKRLTNQFFLENGFKLPALLDRQNLTFPLFIKPIDGSSSVNTFKINNEGQLSPEMLGNEKLLFMEYLSPQQYEEYTVDLYYTNNGDLKCVVPRLRIATRSGEINKGITRKNELIAFVTKNLLHLEGARGCLTLQVFLNKENKTVYGIEVNPRFGGGYPLSYLAGANYIKWIFEEYFENKEVESFDSWEENLLLLRYDAEMIVHEFDYR